MDKKNLTIEDVKQWIMDLYVKDHLIFHPDTPFEDYVEMETEGKRTFTDEEADKLNKELDAMFEFCEGIGVDIYGVCIDVDDEYVNQYEHVEEPPESGCDGTEDGCLGDPYRCD